MKKLIIPVLFVFILSSCNPWKFLGKYDHDVNFDTFKTFGLLNWDPVNDKQVSPQTKEYLLMSIKDEMESRGWVYKKSDADLMVSVFIIIQEETSYSAYSDHYAGYNGYGAVSLGIGVGSGGVGVGAVGYGMPGMYPYTAVSHDYNVGTLVIDLLDHTKKKIVWQGVATGRLAHDEPKEDNIKRDISRLFQTLPVKKVKK